MSKTTVKVIFADGNQLVSTINLDFEGAKNYYLGTSFTFGIGATERSVKCVKVLPVVSVMSEEMLREQYIDCFRMGNDEIQLRYDDGTGYQQEGFQVKIYDNTVQQKKKVFATYTEAVDWFTTLAEQII